MNRIPIIVIALCVTWFTTVNSVCADDYYVNTVNELTTALGLAEANNNADVIHVAAGTYDLTAALTYTPNGADFFNLSIVGEGSDSTILKMDSGSTDRILTVNTRLLTSDANTQISIEGVTFEDGDINAFGGGIWLIAHDADVSISGCSFVQNNATGSGGGAALEFGIPIPPAVGLSSGSIELVNNSFFDNSAGANGGGLFVSGEYPNFVTTMTNNTFGGNDAGTDNTDFGGGAYLLFFDAAAVAHIYNSIFWANTAGAGLDNGSDLYINNFAGATVNLYNSNLGVLADLVTGQSMDLWVVVTGGGAYNQAGNMTQDPLFVDETNGDLHLQSGSPCIDVGDNSAPSLPLEDIDGDTRTIGGTVDMGSDEVQPVQTLSAPTGVGGGCFITSSQR